MRDTNPCSVLVPSWWGFRGCDQFFPPSLDVDTHTSLASASPPTFLSQADTRVPSPRTRKDGTWAQPAARSPSDTMVMGAVQAEPSHVENLRSAASTHVMYTTP